MSNAIAIRPVTITEAMLTASNALETVSLYNEATTYAAGEQVRSDTTFRIYESAIGSNTGNDPADAENVPSKWIDVGPTNGWAMFDAIKSTRTTASSSLVFTLEPGEPINSIGLARILGAHVRVVISDGSSDVYDQTHELISYDGIVDWYSWFFEERIQDDTLILTGLPALTDPVITITVGGSDTVGIGACSIGKSIEIGETQLGGSKEYKDYSTYEDDGFGSIAVYPRGYSFNTEVQLFIANDRLKFVSRELLAWRGVPMFWLLSDGVNVLQHFGFMKRFTPEIQYHNYSLVSLRIEETLESD